MRRLRMRDSGPTAGLDLQAVAVECTNGRLMDGYIRFAHVDADGNEIRYCGSMSPKRLRQLLRNIERRDAKRRRPSHD